VLARRQLHLELFDEGSDVLVGDDFAFPFFDAEYGFIDLHGDVFFDLDLATQTPSFFLLFAGEMDGLGRQDLAATGEDLALALAAGTLTAAGRRQVNTGFAELVEEASSGSYIIDFVSINGNFYITRRYQIFLGYQKDSNEEENNNQENSYSI